MSDAVSWVTPLLLLPGIGLLLVSTSARYEAVHQEIHTLLDHASDDHSDCALHVVRRARLLQITMLALYSAVAVLSTSGLIAALTLWSLDTVHWASWLLLVSGVSCVLAAGIVLIQESQVSLSIVEEHALEIQSKAS